MGDPKLLRGTPEMARISHGDGISELSEFHVAYTLRQTGLYDKPFDVRGFGGGCITDPG